MFVSPNDVLGQREEDQIPISRAPAPSSGFVSPSALTATQDGLAVPDPGGPSLEEQAHIAVRNAQGTPEQAAQALTASSALGVEPAVAQRNLPDLVTELEHRRMRDLTMNRTALSRFLADPFNVTLSRDDINQLAMMDDLFGARQMPTFQQMTREMVGPDKADLYRLRQEAIQRGVEPEMAEREAVLRMSGFQHGDQPGTGAIIPDVNRALQAGVRTVTRGNLYSQMILDTLAGNENPELALQIANFEALEREQLPYDEGFLTSAGEMIPMIVASGIQAQETGGAYASIFAAAAAAGFAPGPQAVLEPIAVPTAAAAGYVGGTVVGGFEAMARLEAGNAFAEFLQMRDENGEALDPKIAALAALGVGGINGMLERVGFTHIPGVGKIFGKLSSRAAEQALRSPSVRRALTRIARDYAGGIAWETSTEMAQEVTNVLGGELAQIANDEMRRTEFHANLDDTFGQENVDRYLDAGVAAFRASAVLGAGPSLYEAAHRGGRAELLSQAAQENQQFFQGLNEAVEGVSLRDRVPERFRAYAQLLEENGVMPNSVYVPLQQLQEAFGDDAVFQEFIEAVGAQDQVASAAATGGDIEIPMGEWVARAAGTPLAVSLENDFRFRPEDMTPREAAEWSKKYFELWSQDVAQAQAAAERVIANDQDAAAVAETIQNGLASIGVDFDEARGNAAILAARAQVAAEGYTAAGQSMTALDWLRSKNLVIQNEETGGEFVVNKHMLERDADGVVYQQGRVVEDENFQRWFSRSAVVDAEGAPLTVYHGTNANFETFTKGDIGFHFGTEEQALARLGDMAAGRRGNYGLSENDDGTVDLMDDDEVIDTFPDRETADRERRNWALDNDYKPRNMIEAHLRIENPLRLPDLGFWLPEQLVTVLEQQKALPPEAIARLDAILDPSLSKAEGLDAVRAELQAAGYDGIVYENTEEGAGDSYIAFESNQIKSVYNRGTWDPNDDNIYHQPMSARVPSSKTPPEDALNTVLTVDYNRALDDTRMLAKNMKTILGYANMRPLTGKGSRTPAVQAEAFVQHAVHNLLSIYDSVPEEIRERSKLWYEGGRRIVEAWAGRYGISEMQAAAAVAVLSPQKDWFQNVTQAERALDIFFTQQDTAWTEEMDEVATRITGEDVQAMEDTRGHTLAEVANNPALAARWVRVFDETYNSRSYKVLTPEGGVLDNAVKKDGGERTSAWGSFSEIAKLVSIVSDGRAENVSIQLGGNHKVRSFYNNLFNPADPRFITIDTHAVAAALMQPLAGADLEVLHNFGGKGSSSSTITGLRGTYALYNEAYRRAAEERGVLPREMQSITWEAIRGLFEAEQKKSLKEPVEAIWRRYKAGEISQDQAIAEVVELAGGYTDPAWAGSEYDETVARTYEGPFAQEMDDRGRAEDSQATVTFEVAPDPNNTELKAKWDALDAATKLEISQQVAQQLVPKVLAELGTSGFFEMQVGGYVGDTNPSLALVVDTPSALIPAAKMLGYALAQDSMMVASREQVPGTNPVGVIEITLPDGWGLTEIEALYDKLYELEKDGKKLVGGFSAANGIMAIANFPDETTKEVLVPTEELAYIIDKHLGGGFNIDVREGHSAFIGKKEYDYDGSLSGGQETDKGRAVRRPNLLRREAERLIDEALGERTYQQRHGGPERLRTGGLDVAARYGEAREGATPVLGVHYCVAPRDSLSGAYYGSGLRGAEAKRVSEAKDERLKHRIHFYVDEGNGILPEQGVGAHVHAVNLDGLYDAVADPLGIVDQVRAADNWDEDFSNQWEAAILDAGFDGVYIPGAQGKQGVAVLLGQDHADVQVEQLQGEAAVYEQLAYHGSPYKFDKFTLDHIGTGEGAQAYGWGLYFAGKKEVAEWYRGTTTSRAMTIDGEVVIPDNFQINLIVANTANDEALAISLRQYIEEFDGNIYADVATAQRILEALSRGAFKRGGEGQLYEVEIPEDDVLLAWDKPLSEQPEAVREALQGELDAKVSREDQDQFHRMNGQLYKPETTPMRWKGEMWYGQLVRKLGGMQAASEYLNSLGIKGIKYLDGTSRGKGEGSYNYVIFDDSAIEILNTYYQDKERKSGSRGDIRFSSNRTLIRLFKTANKSTLLHESGHLFLEDFSALAALPDAPQQVHDDWAALKNWLGNKGERLTEDQHEKFAKAFEAYLLRGKAPTRELQSVFWRFKRWLTRIYRSLKAMKVDLSPEITQVFDRMLATEDMISKAEYDTGISGEYLSAEAAGLSEEEFASYREALAAAHEKAKDQLLAKIIEERKLKDKEELAEERRRIEADARDELLQEPGYRAAFALSKGFMPGDEAHQLGIKLNTQELIDEYGENVTKRLPKMVPPIHSKDGVSMDEAADLLGYGSGDELVKSMFDKDKFSVALAQLVEQRADEYLQTRQDPRYEEYAAQALENDYRVEFLALEEQIARKRIARLEANKERKRQTALNREFKVEDFKAQAQKGFQAQAAREARARALMVSQAAANAIGGMKVNASTQVAKHLQAERRAARAAIKASRKGDGPALIQAKQQQMVAAALASQALKAKDEVESIMRYLAKFHRPGTRKNLAADYLEQIDTLLERFDLRRSTTQKQIEGRKSLTAWVQTQQALGIDPNISEDLLAEARRVSYKELTLDQFRDLRDAIKTIEHIARLKDKLLKAQDKRSFLEKVDQLVEHTEDVFGDKLGPDHLPRKAIKRRGLLSTMDADLTKIEFMCLVLDGGKANGPWWDALYRPINDGVNNKTARFLQIRDKLYGDTLFGRYTSRELGRMRTKKIHIPEIDDSLTKEEILAVALNRGNEHNWSALLEGESWSSAGAEAVLRQLDDRDWAVVQEIWDYLDTFRPEIGALYKRLTGVEPKWVKADGFLTPTGRQLRGGYYPLAADRDLGVLASQRAEAQTVQEMFGGNAYAPRTRNGHIKERKGFGGQRVALSLDVLVRHLDVVTHDLYLREAVIDVDRLIQNKQIQSIIIKALGKDQFDQIRPWLASVAGQQPYEYDAQQRWIHLIRKNATYAIMGLKATVFMSQYAGLLNSIPYLVENTGMGHSQVSVTMLANLRKVMTGKKIAELIAEKSVEMRDRRHNFVQEVTDLSHNFGFGRHVTKWQEGLMYFTALADYHVSCATWKTAYDGKLAAGATEAQAVAFADASVRLSQGSGKTKDLSAVQRGSEWKKMWLMFFSYMNLNYNQIVSSGRVARTSKRIGRFLGEMAFFWIFPVIAAELLAGRGPGDDDEDETVHGWAAKRLLLHPLGMIPFARDAVSVFDGGYARSPSLPGRLFNDTRKLMEEYADDDGDTEALFWKAITVAGYFAPIPSSQAKITFGQLIEYMNNERDSYNPLFYRKN